MSFLFRIAFGLFFIFSGLFFSAPVYSQSEDTLDSISDVYLGLAIPFHTRELIELEYKKSRGLYNQKVQVLLQVSKKGKVEDFSFNQDSVAYVEPLRKQLKKLKFEFLEGLPISFPQQIPIYLQFRPAFSGGKNVDIEFPVNFDSDNGQYRSNCNLLNHYFELNDIKPPKALDIPPLLYPADVRAVSGRYLTISALVKVNKTGELEDIQFPLENMNLGTHQVFSALLNTEFQPLLVNHEPQPSNFFLTFRIFDNLDYPYHPKSDVTRDSTTFHSDLHFMTSYFNPIDIALYPLPREFPQMAMVASGLSVLAHGDGQVDVTIDEDGKVIGISIVSATGNLRGYIRDIMLRLNFYPAVNNLGEPVKFSGRIGLSIDISKKVVYSPEWLEF